MANNEDVARLRQGVEAWNDWRRNNPEYRVDLIGAKLFMWDLAEANLAWAISPERTLMPAEAKVRELRE